MVACRVCGATAGLDDRKGTQHHRFYHKIHCIHSKASVWNSLPESVRQSPSLPVFHSGLLTFCSSLQLFWLRNVNSALTVQWLLYYCYLGLYATLKWICSLSSSAIYSHVCRSRAEHDLSPEAEHGSVCSRCRWALWSWAGRSSPHVVCVWSVCFCSITLSIETFSFVLTGFTNYRCDRISIRKLVGIAR